MKQLRSTVTAVRMLGVFAFILASAVIIITVSIYNVFLIDEGIVEIHEHSQQRFLLENIEFYLLEQELAERALILQEGSADVIAEFEAADRELDHLIPELEALHAAPAEIATLNEDRAHIAEDFAEAQEMVASGELDREQLDDNFRAEAGITQELNDLVFEAETQLEEDVAAVSRENQRATMLGIVGLIAFPLLAVWAFLVASQITQPLLSITNAVVAMGGARYRPELLDEALDRHDGLGALARRIDKLADTLAEREAVLQQEVDMLRGQLGDARRRKLNLTTTKHAPEPAPTNEFSVN